MYKHTFCTRSCLGGKAFASLLFIVLCTAIFCPFPTQAQQYNFSSFSIGEGLPQSQVQTLLQDQYGYIWAGTNGGGISRYDGIRFTTYTIADGLVNNRVNAMFQDNKGNIWVATENGLSQFQPPRGKSGKVQFKNFTVKEGLPSNLVYAAEQDKYGNLWFGTERGISVYSNEQLVPFSEQLPKVVAKEPVFTLHRGEEGAMFLGLENAIVLHDGQSFKVFQLPVSYNKVHAIIAATGKYLVGTSNGVLYFDGQQFAPPHGWEALESRTIFDMAFGLKGTLWLATNDGLAKVKLKNNSFEAEEVKLFAQTEGLNSKEIYKIMLDREDNIWMGTNGGGMIKFISENFIRYTMRPKEEVSLVLAAYAQDDQRRWFGTYSGLYYMEGQRIEPFVVSNFFRQFTVPAVVGDSKGYLWYGITDYGLFRYNTKDRSRLDIVNFTTKEGLPDISVNALATGKSDRVWIGTNDGLSLYHNRKFTNYSSKDGLIHDKVNVLLAGGSGFIWVGTDSGLTVLDPDYPSGEHVAFANLTTSQGLANNVINDILQTDAADILIATDEGITWLDLQPDGAGHFEHGKLHTVPKRHLSTKDGLSSNLVNSLIMDNAGYLWIGSNKGLDRLDYSQWLKDGTTAFIYYGKEEGFTGIECSRHAFAKEPGGNLWLGTIKGAIRYNPKEDRQNEVPPQLHLDNLRLFFEDINWQDYAAKIDPLSGLPQNLSLPYDKNYVAFDFTGISFTAPEKVLYKYRLLGQEKEWQPVTNKSTATYSNLPPGKYTFEVIAANNNGVWNEQPVTYDFVITPPFWRTSAFVIIAIIVALGLIGLIFYVIFNRKVKKKELEEKMANLKLNALRAQMNPHFVFNALNSIQNFINKNDELSANIYLSKFAALMRMILDNSQKSSIPIQEELKALELYLELEKLRFKNKFDYEIVLDQHIDPEAIVIPTMLIQPYVENAINHGIMHKNEQGHIKVALELQGQSILVTVEDDGVGRKLARELKAKQPINHKSVGMGITKDRLEIINLSQQKHMSVEVIDLVNGNKAPAGTRVEIHIPVSGEELH